jgi:hypothetical protein
MNYVERRRNHQETLVEGIIGAITMIFLLVVVPVLVLSLA